MKPTKTTTSTIINTKNLMKAHGMLLCMDRNWLVFTTIADNPGITVTEIFIMLRADQSDTSRRIAELRYYDLVKGDREGNKVHYQVTTKALKIASKINKHISWIK